MAGSVSATTLATIAAVSAVAGAGIGGYAAYESGQSQKKAADYNAEVDRANSLDAQQRGAVAAAEHLQKVRETESTQIAAGAASGINTSTGTALELSTETAGSGALDALRIANNAQRQAYGMNAQADIEEYKGNAAATGGALTAAGTLIGGAGTAASFSSKYNQPAAPATTPTGRIK